jgi:hypothetical protein
MATTMTLAQLMTAVRQRADMAPSGYAPALTGSNFFVTEPELISYINQSYFEFYDLLVSAYEDYFMAPAVQFTTTGVALYDLPDGSNYSGAPALYKLLGVDFGLSTVGNAYVTLKKFNFIDRNRYIYPQLGGSVLGISNPAYRMVGSKLEFIPTPASGQIVQLWYVPRMTQLAALSDTVDGFSGWTEYIITDCAIKCMQKEESDVSVLMVQKAALKQRIEEVAQNRDAGQPSTISDTRRGDGYYGWTGFDGQNGGY